EVAEEGSPSGALPKNVDNLGRGFAWSFGGEHFFPFFLRRTRHAPQPQRKPQKSCGAKNDEIRTPAVMLHQLAAKYQSKRGAEADARVDKRVGEAAMARWKFSDNDCRIAGIGGRFSNAEKQTKKQQYDEAARKAGGERGYRPNCESRGE